MKVYVAGHRGLVGSAVVRRLIADGHQVWWPTPRVDLRDPEKTLQCMRTARQNGCNSVVLAASVVGGIGANASRPVDFLHDNILIACNVIHSAYRSGFEKLVNLGSSCIYPKDCRQPIVEEALLTGALESTNEPYAVAKIAALKLVQAYRKQYGCRYISLMPCNLYGPGDTYDENASHVIPSLICKFEKARLQGGPVRLWGTGKPLREFLHVDDLARAVVLAMQQYGDDLWLNVGSDDELQISDLAGIVAGLVGYECDVEWDDKMPDGTPRKKLDWSRLKNLGWAPRISLIDGIRGAIEDFRNRGLALRFRDHLDL